MIESNPDNFICYQCKENIHNFDKVYSLAICIKGDVGSRRNLFSLAIYKNNGDKVEVNFCTDCWVSIAGKMYTFDCTDIKDPFA